MARMTAAQLRQDLKQSNQQMVLDAATAERIEQAYDAIPWETLAADGFEKSGDYCFIYSYPPVRTLAPIEDADIFRRAEGETPADEVGLYLHIPYCSGICSYCYFAKVVDNGNAPVDKDEYIDLLIREIDDKFAKYNPNARIANVHIGGGTPSILEDHQINRLLAYIHARSVRTGIEITVECAPETVHDRLDRLRNLRDNGVNRISIGVESLDDRVLKVMARRHGADMTHRSVENVRTVGFDNVNADLIYALPAQSVASWVDTLRQVNAWGLESVTVYRLRLHPMKRISLLEKDMYPSYRDGLMMQIAHGLICSDAGYLRLTSQKYVNRREKFPEQPERKRGVKKSQLLSAGCGAYGFLNSTFYWNTKSLGEYGERIRSGRSPVWMGQALSPTEAMHKAMVLGVHTSRGIDRVGFREVYGVDPVVHFADRLRVPLERGLLQVTETAIVPTELGYFFADELSVRFYSDPVRSQLAALGMKYGMFFDQDRYA